MSFVPSLRRRATLLDVFRAYPESSRPLLEVHEALLRGPSPFTEAEREFIAAFVSRLNRCDYCRSVHSATAKLLGAEPELVAQLGSDFDHAGIRKSMKPIFRFAEKLTRTPSAITRADADSILAAGWPETAIYHAAAVTGLFNFMNRLVEGLGIKPDPDYVAIASRRIAEHGYLPLVAMLRDPLE